MTDVAERLQLSHALLYRYVESKEALLELAARYAMDQEADLEAVVPLATPPKGQVLELIRSWLAVHAAFPRLRAALEREPDGDAAAELAGIIDELYDFVEQNRLLLLLLESLAGDYPELGQGSVNERKRSHIGRLAAFLGSRCRVGRAAPARRSGDRRPLPGRVRRLVCPASQARSGRLVDRRRTSARRGAGAAAGGIRAGRAGAVGRVWNRPALTCVVK